MRPSGSSAPVPATTVTLRPLSSDSRPDVSRSTTACLRVCEVASSSAGSEVSTPNSAAPPHGPQHLGGLEQLLGRDAAPVQAGAADPLLLDDGDVHAGARAVERGRVPARTATEDDEIEVVGHGRAPFFARSFAVRFAKAWSLAGSGRGSHLDRERHQDHQAGQRREDRCTCGCSRPQRYLPLGTPIRPAGLPAMVPVASRLQRGAAVRSPGFRGPRTGEWSRSSVQRLAGAAKKLPVPEGTWAIGAGLIIVGSQRVRLPDPRREAADRHRLQRAQRALGDRVRPHARPLPAARAGGRPRGRAPAGAREGGGPLVKRAAFLGAILAGAVGLAALDRRAEHHRQAVRRPDAILLVALFSRLVFYYVAFITRGTLSGNGRFGPYGLMHGSEGTVRVWSSASSCSRSGVGTAGLYGLRARRAAAHRRRDLAARSARAPDARARRRRTPSCRARSRGCSSDRCSRSCSRTRSVFGVNILADPSREGSRVGTSSPASSSRASRSCSSRRCRPRCCRSSPASPARASTTTSASA